MRVRVAVLAAAVTACGCAAIPSIAAAHGPVRNRALTIHNSPRSIVAGDPVLIYGRLLGRGAAKQRIVLWHRINPRGRFTVIGRTDTDRSGRYEFTRAEGIVESNRSWYATGPALSHSETVHERVAAEVTLTASSSEASTRHPITFTGQVSPGHAGEPIEIQAQKGNSTRWHTIKVGRLSASSSYSIQFAWRFPGQRNVRAVFGGDRRNSRGVSAVSTVIVEQTEVPSFTIASSEPVVPNQIPATISGKLLKPSGSAPEPGVSVALYVSTPGRHNWTETQTTTTGADGSYSFTVQGSTNELYQARTTFAPARHSAVVYQGVQDVVSITASTTSAIVGRPVTFSGNVAPGKPGDAVYLERLGRDGNWHIVKSSKLDGASDYSIGWTFGTPGDKQVRVQVLGDPENVTGASSAVPITVTLPPVASLPNGG
jgi:hypothetical protein